MSNYSPEQLLEFWQRGKTIEDAIIEYTDTNITSPVRQDVPSEFGLENLQLLMNDVASSFDYQRKLREDLIDQIKMESLIAVGYEFPTKSTDMPINIPEHVWDNPKIDQKKSSVIGNGLHFVSVRVVKKQKSFKAKKLLESAVVVLPEPKIIEKLVGRPSQKSDLISAFNWMIKNNRINKEKSLKAHMDEIKIALKRVHPELPYIEKLNYKTLIRCKAFHGRYCHTVGLGILINRNGRRKNR